MLAHTELTKKKKGDPKEIQQINPQYTIDEAIVQIKKDRKDGVLLAMDMGKIKS